MTLFAFNQHSRKHSRRIHTGSVTLDYAFYALLLVMMLVVGTAISTSMDSSQARQTHIAKVFSGWFEDKKGHDQALAEQQLSKKPMLVYIYAPWCPHCKEFSATVLTDPVFENYAKQFPHVRLTPDHGADEKEIMASYGASGFPSFYIVRPNGQRQNIETFVLLKEGGGRQKTTKEFIVSLENALRQNAQ